jgi:hypothetical protein
VVNSANQPYHHGEGSMKLASPLFQAGKNMRKTNNLNNSAFELLRGPKVPDSVLRRCFAEVKRNRAKEIDKKWAMRQKAAKYLSRLQSPSGDGANRNPKTEKAVQGLREITDQVARQKLIAPRIAAVPPGILAGSYTLRFAPPYADLPGAYASATGNSTVLTTAAQNLGQYDVGVASDVKNLSVAGASYTFGVSLAPLFGVATVRAWIDAQIAFSWWVNSIGPTAWSQGQAGITLVQPDRQIEGVPWAVRNTFLNWYERVNNEVDFDIGSMAAPASIEATGVTGNVIVQVSVWAYALADGWPGSLAGANLSITVPSITVEVALEQPEAHS